MLEILSPFPLNYLSTIYLGHGFRPPRLGSSSIVVPGRNRCDSGQADVLWWQQNMNSRNELWPKHRQTRALDLLHSTYNILIDMPTGAPYIAVNYSVLLMKSQHWKGNPVKVRDCPAAVSRNESSSIALVFSGPGSKSE
jgi:hypothetical protein